MFWCPSSQYSRLVNALGRPIERLLSKEVSAPELEATEPSLAVVAALREHQSEAPALAAVSPEDYDQSLVRISSLINDLEAEMERADFGKLETLWNLLNAQCKTQCQKLLDSGGNNFEQESETKRCPIWETIETIRDDWTKLETLYARPNSEVSMSPYDSVRGLEPGQVMVSRSDSVSSTEPREMPPSSVASSVPSSEISEDSSASLAALQRRRQSLEFYRDTFLAHATRVFRARLRERAALRAALANKRDLLSRLYKQVAEYENHDLLEKENQLLGLVTFTTTQPGKGQLAYAKNDAEAHFPSPESTRNNASAFMPDEKLAIPGLEIPASSENVQPTAAFPATRHGHSIPSQTPSIVAQLQSNVSRMETEVTALENLALVALQRLLQIASQEAAVVGSAAKASPRMSEGVCAQDFLFLRVLWTLAQHAQGMSVPALQSLIIQETKDLVMAQEMIESLRNAFILEYNAETNSVSFFSAFQQSRDMLSLSR
jgi:hypothetical protein